MTDSETAADRFGLLPSDFDYDAEAAAIAERFLGNVGCGVAEAEALRLEGGTAEMMRSWEQSRRFRRALAKCREMGEDEREYAARKAERRQDVFATPPRPGQVDLAAETYDPADPPQGGLARWLRRIGVIADRQAPRDEPRPSGQREISVDAMTDRDWAGVRQQEAEKLQRAQAERESPTTEGPAAQGQKWDQKKEWMSPDGTAWQGAPGVRGGLFTAHGNPDSVPTP